MFEMSNFQWLEASNSQSDDCMSQSIRVGVEENSRPPSAALGKAVISRRLLKRGGYTFICNCRTVSKFQDIVKISG